LERVGYAVSDDYAWLEYRRAVDTHGRSFVCGDTE
jgi:hypothetical protein